MTQLQKKFTDDQVKDLIERYLIKKIERKYIQEILNIGKGRIRIIKGHTARNKVIAVDDMSQQEIIKRLSSYLES